MKIAAAVACNLKKPRTNLARVSQTTKSHPRLKQCLLENVLGVMQVTDVPANESGKRLLVAPNQFDERMLVTFDAATNQCPVGGFRKGPVPPTT